MSLCSSFPSVKCSTKEVGIKLLSNHGLILAASNAAFSLVTTFLVFFSFFKKAGMQSLKVRGAEVEMFHQPECCELYYFYLFNFFASYT